MVVLHSHDKQQKQKTWTEGYEVQTGCAAKRSVVTRAAATFATHLCSGRGDPSARFHCVKLAQITQHNCKKFSVLVAACVSFRRKLEATGKHLRHRDNRQWQSSTENGRRLLHKCTISKQKRAHQGHVLRKDNLSETEKCSEKVLQVGTGQAWWVTLQMVRVNGELWCAEDQLKRKLCLP